MHGNGLDFVLAIIEHLGISRKGSKLIPAKCVRFAFGPFSQFLSLVALVTSEAHEQSCLTHSSVWLDQVRGRKGREGKGKEGSGSLLRQRRLSVPPPSRLGTLITEPYHRFSRMGGPIPIRLFYACLCAWYLID